MCVCALFCKVIAANFLERPVFMRKISGSALLCLSFFVSSIALGGKIHALVRNGDPDEVLRYLYDESEDPEQEVISTNFHGNTPLYLALEAVLSTDASFNEELDGDGNLIFTGMIALLLDQGAILTPSMEESLANFSEDLFNAIHIYMDTSSVDSGYINAMDALEPESQQQTDNVITSEKTSTADDSLVKQQGCPCGPGGESEFCISYHW